MAGAQGEQEGTPMGYGKGAVQQVVKLGRQVTLYIRLPLFLWWRTGAYRNKNGSRVDESSLNDRSLEKGGTSGGSFNECS